MRNSEKTWIKYWKSQNLGDLVSKNITLSSFQNHTVTLLKTVIEQNRIQNASILNAGSGIDLISLKLKKNYPELKMTLVDISKEVLMANKKLFGKHGEDVNIIQANIVEMPFEDCSFDIVFNTGVFEHFDKNVQNNMFNEIIRVTKVNGLFVTVNPCDYGKIYKFCMNYAIGKRIWPFGNEEPIRSLKYLEKNNVVLEREYAADFTHQLAFLSYISPIFSILCYPLTLLGRSYYFSKLLDMTVGKVLGHYLIISIFRKI